LDLKIDGISLALLKDCLAQAKKARLFILDKMTQSLSQPRENLSSFAPRIEKIMINTEKIGAVIAPAEK